MEEDHNAGPERESALRLPPLESYLRECDFSHLTERDWRRIGPRTLGVILSRRPELYETCRRWIELQPESWAELLQIRPELAAECDCWEKFSAVELVGILRKQPQLVRHVSNWQVLPESAWGLLLLSRPELAEFCPYWIDFRLVAPWIGTDMIAACRENAERLQRNVPWAPPSLWGSDSYDRLPGEPLDALPNGKSGKRFSKNF